ncbi:Uncharacterised protein [Klebsiella oxytoca]|nr:Uncharacterised protein [Klebsiella oxytoca]
MFFYTQKGEAVLINMVLYTEDIVLTGSILGTLFLYRWVVYGCP